MQFDVAEKHLEKALEIRMTKLGPYHSRTGQTLKRIFIPLFKPLRFVLIILDMMTLFQSQEDFAKAIEYGQKAQKIYERLSGPINAATVANVSFFFLLLRFFLINKDTGAIIRTVLTTRGPK